MKNSSRIFVGTLLMLLLGACGAPAPLGSGHVSTAAAAPKSIAVRIDAVPPGTTQAKVLADKSACNNYSRYDTLLYVQCMQGRGYQVSIYGPDGQPTTIQQLYSRQAPAFVSNPPPSALAPSAVPSSAFQSPLSPERQAELRDIESYLNKVVSSGGIYQPYRYSHQQILKDPSASQAETKLYVAICFAYRGSQTMDPHKTPAWVTNDASFKDEQTARIWYQLVIDQLQAEHPDISTQGRLPSWDPTGHQRFVLLEATSSLAQLPTDASRQAGQNAIKQQREAADKAAREEQLIGARVHAESAAELERQMEFCEGVIGGLHGTDFVPKFKEFGGEVFRQAWPVTEAGGLTTDLTALAGGFGFRYARGAKIFEQSHTEGEARRTATRGGETVRQYAEKNDVFGLVVVLHRCDKESDELAARMDW